MKEAKIDFDSLKVVNSLSNRGLAQKRFSPLGLIGTEIIGGGSVERPPHHQPIKVRQGARLLRVNNTYLIIHIKIDNTVKMVECLFQ